MDYDPNRDGVDHINIYSKGKTELGRKLSNFAYAPFTLPEDGEFTSVEGYWYWLSCEDDRLRTLDGFEAKRVGRRLRDGDSPQDPEFKEKIRRAISAKIEQHPEIADMLRESTLPLTHYYVSVHTPSEPKEYRWITEHLEGIRRELRGE